MSHSLSDAASSHNNNFLLLRHILVLLVLLNHSFSLLFIEKVVPEPLFVLTNFALNFGSGSVAIFFTISGLLIAQSATTSKSIRSFLLRRWWRVFPALLLSVAFSLIVVLPIIGLSLSGIVEDRCHYGVLAIIVMALLFQCAALLPSRISDDERIANKIALALVVLIVLLLSGLSSIGRVPNDLSLFNYIHVCSALGVCMNIGTPDKVAINLSIWSIRYELLMYAVAALILFFPKQQWRFIWSNLYLASILFLLFPYDNKMLENLDWIPPVPRFITCFGGGVLLHSFSKHIHTTFLLPCICAAIVGIGFLTGMLTTTFLIFGTVGIVLLFARPRLIKGWTDLDLSYGMFVFGYPIQKILFVFLPNIYNPYMFFSIAAVISAAIAMLSWRYVERPCLQYVRTITR